MQVTLKTRHMELTPALKEYAEAKLSEAVSRVFDRPALTVSIELADLAHVQNGADKECKVTVHMPKRGVIVINESDDNMYKAIDLAHDRLLERVKRQRGRQLRVSRQRKAAEMRRQEVATASLTAG